MNKIASIDIARGLPERGYNEMTMYIMRCDNKVVENNDRIKHYYPRAYCKINPERRAARMLALFLAWLRKCGPVA